MRSQQALLLIADIGGYTRFMKVHRINLAHAQDVVARLLESVIDASSPSFKLAKLEGDAAFFYCTFPSDGKPDLFSLSQQVADIRRAFLRCKQAMEIDRLCTCDGCVQVKSLNLKFVAHLGEIAFQRIKRFTELAGVDVVVVHRMLKNDVPVREYVLMTRPVFDRIDPSIRPHAQPLLSEMEGLGSAETFFIDLNAIADELPTVLKPSKWRSVWSWLRMTVRSLPYLAGLKTPCDGFRNLSEIAEVP